MSVTRILEQPRVTKPYTRARSGRRSWPPARPSTSDCRPATCADHGRRADLRLDRRPRRRRNGTRRPSGPTKRELADTLIRRLQRRFAPGGMLHYGQGKWYPGEPLPRWAFALYWRGDGDAALAQPGPVAAEDGRRRPPWPMPSASSLGLTERLGLDPSWRCRPTRTRRFPAPSRRCRRTSTPPTTSSTTRRSARGSPRSSSVAWTSPPATCCRSSAGRPGAAVAWRSERWDDPARQAVPGSRRFAGRASACRSTPDLGAAGRASDSVVPARSVRGARGRCRRTPPTLQPRQQAEPPASGGAARQQLGAVRTALAIEPRDGQLCIFMPPTEGAEDFADARRRGRGRPRPRSTCRCMIEGYPPPHDPRLNVIKVTPDPGVIEVNIHPSPALGRSRSRSPRRSTRRRARPGSAPSKFMLDGRHTGTGGGNHIVLGGETRRRTARSCAGPTCSPAWSPIGRTTHRCPTCSPACSSARPARRRASTRRATTSSTSWRSRSAQVPDPRCRAPARPGWSTASSATCWSTSPATRTGPRSASTSSTRPTARPAGSAWSSSAPSRCRRTRG